MIIKNSGRRTVMLIYIALNCSNYHMDEEIALLGEYQAAPAGNFCNALLGFPTVNRWDKMSTKGKNDTHFSEMTGSDIL